MRKGSHHTEEMKQKMSNERKGICINTGRTHFKRGQIGYWRNKNRPPLSKEWRDNMSKAAKGHIKSKEHRKNLSKIQRPHLSRARQPRHGQSVKITIPRPRGKYRHPRR